MTENMIKTVKIQKIIDECDGIRTIYFNMKEVDPRNYIPPKSGQFVMVWVPGVDEIPMSLSGYDDLGTWSITVKTVGECTAALNHLNIGDYIGIRGPLGNGFKLPDNNIENIFIIGGGIGMAPLKCLVRELCEQNLRVLIIEGAKIGTDIIFTGDFDTLDDEFTEIFYCTDDGSYGLEGTASKTFKNVIKKFSNRELSKSEIYTCGPEKMMHEIFQICELSRVRMQASLERMMRCGCGLCGLCTLDPLGLLVCKDGPVFNSEILREIHDFGKYKRDITGNRITIE